MVNALECLNAIDELRECRRELEAGELRQAARRMHSFRSQGQWEYGRLGTAHDLALEIAGMLKTPGTFGEATMKKFILHTIQPILEMKIRHY
jgi:hypothetical protein